MPSEASRRDSERTCAELRLRPTHQSCPPSRWRAIERAALPQGGPCCVNRFRCVRFQVITAGEGPAVLSFGSTRPGGRALTIYTGGDRVPGEVPWKPLSMRCEDETFSRQPWFRSPCRAAGPGRQSRLPAIRLHRTSDIESLTSISTRTTRAARTTFWSPTSARWAWTLRSCFRLVPGTGSRPMPWEMTPSSSSRDAIQKNSSFSRTSCPTCPRRERCSSST